MDPNHWNTLNQQYGRVPGPPLHTQARIDMPLLEQAAAAGLASSGLGHTSGLGAVVPAPVPAHTALPAARLGLNYPAIATQYESTAAAQYKSAAAAAEQVSRNSYERYAAAVAFAKSSLFNTDPHTMKEPAPTNQSSSQIGHSISNYPESSAFSSAHHEPPPAHSGSHRHSSSQRSSYEQGPLVPEARHPNVAFALERPRESPSVPPTAHSNAANNRYEAYQVHQSSQIQRQSCQQEASRQYQEPHHSQPTYIDSPPASVGNINSQRGYRDSPQHHHSSHQLSYQSSPTPQVHHKKSSTPYSSYSAISSAYSSGHTSSIGVLSSAGHHSSGSRIEPSLSLQDLAHISAHQQKLAVHDNACLSRSLYPEPAQVKVVLQMSPPIPPIDTSDLVTSPRTTQVQLSKASSIDHSSPMLSSVSLAHLTPAAILSQSSPHSLPIQAIADSTTVPKPKKKRARPPKKKAALDDQVEVAMSNMNSAVEQKLAVQSITDHGLQAPQLLTYETVDPHSIGFGHNGTYQSIPLMGKVSVECEPTFMTNTFGNAFVNPNEILNTHIPQAETGLPNGVTEYEDYEGYSPGRKYRTKAEQKSMPVEVDDEFAHLAQTPVQPSNEPDKIRSRPPGGSEPPSQDHPPPPQPPPPKSSGPGFQSSFLSFLQGKKPETLSSVTNQSITQKPTMPKYIPDTRPIRRPEPPMRRESSEDEKLQRIKQTKGRASYAGATPSVTLSDDDAGSRSQTVKNAKSGVSKASRAPAKRGRQAPRSASKKKKRDYYIDDDSPEEIVLSDDEEEVEWMDEEEEEIRNLALKETKAAVPTRERSARAAKTKVEEKREERKKRKADSKPVYSDDDDVDFVALDDSTASEKEYDSDNDPVWIPGLTAEPEKRQHSDSEDESKRPKKRGRPAPSASTSSAPKARAGPTAQTGRPRTVIMAPDAGFEALDPAFVHDYQRGDFVIDRKHLTEYEKYPIWKIDAGRLLQKYEPFDKDEKLLHRSLSTYSSWSEDIRKSFKAIKVKTLHNMGQPKQETVEVLEEYRPKPPDESTEEDDLMQPFNVFLQILLSQALEPGFLQTILDEDDDYYKDPLKQLDKMLEEKKAILFEKAKFSEDFLEALKSRPYYLVTEHPSLNTNCQAMPDRGLIACKKVLFYGHDYDRESLEGAEKTSEKTVRPSEFNLSLIGSRALPLCHCVHHYKCTLYKKCKKEVADRKEKEKKDQFSELLDSCLQDRTWVQQLFRDLKQMLESCDKKASS